MSFTDHETVTVFENAKILIQKIGILQKPVPFYVELMQSAQPSLLIS